MPPKHLGWTRIAIPVVGLFLLVGCDSSLQPIDEDAGLFSVYGYLSLTKNQHFLRIKDLGTPLLPDSTRTINATVTLTNLATGQSETLTDSVVSFKGVFTHNFRSDQAIQPDTRYRITVEQGGGQTQATATMPEKTKVDFDPSGPIKCTESVFVNFRNVPEKRLLRMSVGIPWRNHRNWVPQSNFDTGAGETLIERFDAASIARAVIPERILGTVGFQAEKFCSLLDDNKIYVAYTHFGPDWPADSVRTNPTQSTVKNGLGIFGGLHRDTLMKTIDLPE